MKHSIRQAIFRALTLLIASFSFSSLEPVHIPWPKKLGGKSSPKAIEQQQLLCMRSRKKTILPDDVKEKKFELDFIKTDTTRAHSIEKKVSLRTSDGLTRSGILTLRNNAKGNVVLCHPAAYDKDFFIPYVQKVFPHYNCLRFDLRRHGDLSRRQCTTLGKKEIREVEAAVELFKRHPKTRHLPVYGIGVSLGAATLIEAEGHTPLFDGLILQSAFESLREQVKRTFTFFGKVPLMHNLIFREPVRAFVKLKYRIRSFRVYPERSIKNVHIPVFLIHAKNDPTVDFVAFEKLYDAGKHCIKATWTPDTGRHTELFKTFPDLYAKKCNTFLNEIANEKRYLEYRLAEERRLSKTLLTQGEQLCKKCAQKIS